MAFIKAILPGFLISWVVSAIIGSQGSRGGWAAIHRITLEGVTFHWSWPIFAIGVALAWAIFWMME